MPQRRHASLWSRYFFYLFADVDLRGYNNAGHGSIDDCEQNDGRAATFSMADRGFSGPVGKTR